MNYDGTSEKKKIFIPLLSVTLLGPKSIRGSAISSDVRMDKVPECGRGLGEQQTEKILHKIVELEWVPEIECLDSESSFFPPLGILPPQ